MNQPPVIGTTNKGRLALFIKLGGMGLMIALLHLPLFMIHGVLRERRNYQEQATREVAGIWGQRQLVTGPVLAVPYVYRANVVRSKMVAGKVVQFEESDQVAATAYFLPEALAVTGTVEPEIRRRGIYDTVVYSAKMKLAGEFLPDFAVAGIVFDRVDWEKAQVLFGVSDLRGIRIVSPVSINGGQENPFEAADAVIGAGLLLAARIDGAAPGAKMEFVFDAGLQGSERLDIVPAGKATRVTLNSPWADPSFGGAYLPTRRSVGPGGFTAEWETAHFSRGFGQSWNNRSTDSREMLQKFNGVSFGVAFTQPVDGYRLVERAEKYGVLFFVLVFTVFFLFEVTASLRIHPLQYLLVGFALCLFFLGFLALSEFWPVGRAYGVAAAACTALVSCYALTFLQSGRRTLIIAGGLGATYGYLYFVLKSQDFALLAGTLALFAALAVVMYCTRQINWYDPEASRTPNAEPVGP